MLQCDREGRNYNPRLSKSCVREILYLHIVATGSPPPIAETNRILGVLCRELLRLGAAETRMPALKCLPQIVVQNVHPNLQQEVRTARRPSHLLLFDESFCDDLVDRGLDETGGNTLAASVSFPIVNDGSRIAIDVSAKLVQGSRQFLQYNVCRSSGLTVFFPRALNIVNEAAQGFFCAEYIAMPQEPLYTLKLAEDLVFRHAAVGAARTASGLQELFNAHRNVKPIEDVFGVRMQESRQLPHRVATVG